jgi:uncharacterized OsmC-like protein
MVEDLISTVNAIKQTPTLATFQFRVRNQWIDGGRNESTADTFYGAGQESSVEGDVDLQGFLGLDEKVRNGFQGIRIHFKIKADVPDEQLQEICQFGPQYSSLFDTLTKGVPISVTGDRL